MNPSSPPIQRSISTTSWSPALNNTQPQLQQKLQSFAQVLKSNMLCHPDVLFGWPGAEESHVKIAAGHFFGEEGLLIVPDLFQLEMESSLMRESETYNEELS